MTAPRSDSSDRALARAEAQKQWNANPCGAIETEAFDQTFFDKVEEERYRQQYWQLDFFDYTSFAGKRVLEVGIGLGTDIKQFARNGAECHGVDITDRHLELTKLNFELSGYTIDLRKADAASIPFPDGHFDCVHSFGVLHHIPDVDTVLKEIHRVLKPEGVLQTAVYHRASIHTLLYFVKGVVDASLFRTGIKGVLARIERGADGKEIAPYVKLYSKAEWRGAASAAGFAPVKLGIRQVNFDRFRWLNAFRPFEKMVGWYVCGIFTKS
ncbi:MAG TPA: class I SAM-dependent methyltransferase [Bryobacteraceae bacterium]|nr:class I SAM-dependent methyltransferase [Bryobacteraceae bacterium]